MQSLTRSDYVLGVLRIQGTGSVNRGSLFLLVLTVLCLLFSTRTSWCEPSEDKGRSSEQPTPTKEQSGRADRTAQVGQVDLTRDAVSSSSFDGLRALRDLQALIHLGHRYYGAPRREEAIKTLVTLLSQSGAEVSKQSFSQLEKKSGVTYTLTNMIARFAPERPIRVVLGSHWDTRLWAEEDADPARRHQPITGANDGSSGLAVLIELGRQLKSQHLSHIGVDIVFFDGEEFGRPGSHDYCAGSRYFVEHLSSYFPVKKPTAVIVIDMVGDRDLSFPPEKSSIVKARALTSLIWREGVRLNASAFVRGLGRGAGSQRPPVSRWIVDDHTPFQDRGIPATLIIDLDYKHWHTHQDTLDKVSADSLKQTGDVLLATLKRIDHLAQQP